MISALGVCALLTTASPFGYVKVVGGTIDGTPIGLTTPSTGAFTTLSALAATGQIAATLNGGTQTGGSSPVVSMSQTWNNVATAFTAILLQITSTNSAAASLLMDLQIGGSSKFNIDKFGNTIVLGNLSVKFAGNGLLVKEGSNAKQGLSSAMVAGTLTVANTAVTANSRIILTRQDGGTNPGAVYVSARVAGTSFTITSTNAADTGQVAYQIFEPA